MTTPPTLPSVPGLAWSRHRKPTFNTRVATHTSGREVRVSLQQYPLYEFEATYDGLTSYSTVTNTSFAGLGASSLQSIEGFFLQMMGQANPFLYVDPGDNTVTGQPIGIGNGTATQFLMVRTFGGWVDPVGWVTNLANVYLNGVAQSAGAFALTEPNTLTFTAAPASSVAVTADFSFAFYCRFLDDEMDFEEFMSHVWKLESMKFRSLKSWLGG